MSRIDGAFSCYVLVRGASGRIHYKRYVVKCVPDYTSVNIVSVSGCVQEYMALLASCCPGDQGVKEPTMNCIVPCSSLARDLCFVPFPISLSPRFLSSLHCLCQLPVSVCWGGSNTNTPRGSCPSSLPLDIPCLFSSSLSHLRPKCSVSCHSSACGFTSELLCSLPVLLPAVMIPNCTMFLQEQQLG